MRARSAFSAPSDGDMRADRRARGRFAASLGVGREWASASQVHGSSVVVVDGPGVTDAADAIVTVSPLLPVAVFTADCLGVVLSGPGTVGVAHAGWRGLAAGVVESTAEVMESDASPPDRAEVGPHIGSCCFEVGDDVASLFPDDVRSTRWSTTSVDLAGVLRRRLPGLEIVVHQRCTACGGGFSHRRDGTSHRLAAVGWVA